jgi:protein-S-isoprenylcysteine O-methyltransferase Ste14
MSHLLVYMLVYVLLLSCGILILRLLVRNEYLRQGRLSVVTSLLQAMIFFIYGGFPYLYVSDNWPAVHVNPLVHFIGGTFIIAGLASLLCAMIRLGVPQSLGRDMKELQQTGPYRRTRNPQALACGLYVIGFAMLWPSWYAAGWTILYFVLVHTMIVTEEEHLLHTHGEQYLGYFQEVPRYFALSSIQRRLLPD